MPPQGVPLQRVENYLTAAILTTIFCCVPLGIVSIVYAAQVNGKVQAGDVHGAMECSQKAKNWATAAFVCGLIAGLMYMLLAVAANA